MNYSAYQTEINALRATIADLPDGDTRLFSPTQTAVISASIYNLMPEADPATYPAMVREINMFQKWATRDLRHVALVDTFEACGAVPAWQEMASAPKIFCSFHLGSYSVILLYLMRQGLKVSMLVDAAVAGLQAEEFYAASAELAQHYGLGPDIFRFCDTSDNNIMRTLTRELRQGRSVVIFIDGNLGRDGRTGKAGNMMDIEFCGRTLQCRKGVGYLSYLAKTPVIPVSAKRGPEDLWRNTITFGEAICGNPAAGRDEYCRTVTQQAYAHLEASLKDAPTQWEAWRYIDKSLTKAPAAGAVTRETGIDEDTGLQMNLKRYLLSPFTDTQELLFDRSSYNSVLISKEFAAFLNSFGCDTKTVADCLAFDRVTHSTLDALIDKEILITTTHA